MRCFDWRRLLREMQGGREVAPTPIDTRPLATTPAQFELFKRECQYWIARLGLVRWEISLLHRDESAEGREASCQWNDTARWAHLTLSTHNRTGLPSSDRDVALSAFHECCELLLADISHRLFEYLRDDEVVKLTHTVINTLQAVLWEPYWLARHGEEASGNGE